MSDKKRNTFFHLIFCSCAKNIRFFTFKTDVFSTQKNTVKKSFTFFFEQIVIFDAAQREKKSIWQRKYILIATFSVKKNP
jgi:hypothetical protein